MSRIWEMHRQMLSSGIAGKQNNARRLAVDSLTAIERNSAAYQGEALRNDEPQPMLIIRMKPKEIKITILPNDEIYAGDYIDVFNERWLVIETFTDENTNRFAKAWLCNQLFRFHNGTSDIIERRAVLDDGTYNSSRNNQQLPLEEGRFRVYLPLDDYTQKIFVDKRFAVGVAVNQRLKQILTVLKVVFIDATTGNLSDGDKLLKLRMEKHEFNRERDNMEKFICDYIPAPPIEDDVGADDSGDDNDNDGDDTNVNSGDNITTDNTSAVIVPTKLSWRHQK